MSIPVKKGEKLPLEVLLSDGDTTRFPVAHVTDENDIAVLGSPFELTHLAFGKYINNDYTIGDEKRLKATYIIYSDSNETDESHERVSDLYHIDTTFGDMSLDSLAGEIFDDTEELIGFTDDDEELTGYVEEGAV